MLKCKSEFVDISLLEHSVETVVQLSKGDIDATDTEARKRGYQTGLDTLVVHAVNDEY